MCNLHPTLRSSPLRERVKAIATTMTGHSNPPTSIVPPRSNLTRPFDQYLEKICADFEKIFQILRAFSSFCTEIATGHSESRTSRGPSEILAERRIGI
jgi:hypothetical protein